MWSAMTVPPRPQLATVLHITGDAGEWAFGELQPVVVGRDPRCNVLLTDERVSRMHLGVRREPEGWVVRDLGSRNGTWVDGVRLDGPQTAVRLEPGRQHRVVLGGPQGTELWLWSGPDPRAVAPAAPPPDRVLVIGRDPACDIVVPGDPLLSRRHAAVATGSAPTLRDLGSFNGTYLNGSRIDDDVPLAVGDRIGVGRTTFVWDGRTATQPGRHVAALDARHLGVATRAGRMLLDDVSFIAQTGQLVAILGPSGAGKSTLLGAITGLHPAGTGKVMWDGRDLYREYDHLRFLIGLVPQEDVLHRQLTVGRALDFAARLRLPPDTTAAERRARVRKVLEEVHLLPQIDQRVDLLSGGQRKRTSIALELLTAPPLLFLDEPTSGLDPGLDRQVMEGLRDLADGGRVVVVVTHSVLALDRCDRVLVMAPGGRVAFFGPPDRLLPFFGVPDHAAMFRALEDPVWVSRFAASTARRDFVGRTGVGVPPAAARPPVPRRPQPLRQLATLIRRNLAVVAADRLLLVLLVGMPVVLAAMAHAFPGDGGLSVRAATEDPGEPAQRIIVLVVGAALMGAAIAVREFVGERPIYRREHAVGLSPTAYLVSKVVVLGGAVALQSVAFTLLALLGLPGPDDPRLLPWGRLEVAVPVAGVGVAMVIASLAVSALASSTEQTMPALVGLVMGQLVFCGGLFTLHGRPGLEQLGWVLPARAGYAAVASTVALPPGRTPEPLFEATTTQWAIDLGILAVQSLVFLALAAWGLARSVSRAGGPR
jgi:ABC-type multidrug transport system ATPase subunit